MRASGFPVAGDLLISRSTAFNLIFPKRTVSGQTRTQGTAASLYSYRLGSEASLDLQTLSERTDMTSSAHIDYIAHS